MLSPGLVIILIVSSLVLLAVGLPMALGKVPPNPIYGVRLPVTFRSRAAWDAANTHYGWWLIAAGAGSLPVILIIWAGGFGEPAIFVWLGALVVPILGGLPFTVRRAYQAERRERAEADRAHDSDTSESDDRDSLPPQFSS